MRVNTLLFAATISWQLAPLTPLFIFHLVSLHLNLCHLIPSQLFSADHNCSHAFSCHLSFSHLCSRHLNSSQLFTALLMSGRLNATHLIPSHSISSHFNVSQLLADCLTSSHLFLSSSQLMSTHLMSSHLFSPQLLDRKISPASFTCLSFSKFYFVGCPRCVADFFICPLQIFAMHIRLYLNGWQKLCWHPWFFSGPAIEMHSLSFAGFVWGLRSRVHRI